VAGNEPAAGKMPRSNRVRKPPGPHRRNILTAPRSPRKDMERAERIRCEKGDTHHLIEDSVSGHV